MFVLQVTGIDWQPSGILTHGLGSLRGAMLERWTVRWWRRGSPFLSDSSSPHVRRSFAFVMSPECTQE